MKAIANLKNCLFGSFENPMQNVLEIVVYLEKMLGKKLTYSLT